MSTRVGRCAVLAVAAAFAVGCGGGDDDPRCFAKRALRGAVDAVNQAELAERAGDQERVVQQIDAAERLIRTARRNLSAASPTSIERNMLEAAEYLDFVVGRYRASGAVDGTLAPFAARELNRAPAPGEAALGC